MKKEKDNLDVQNNEINESSASQKDEGTVKAVKPKFQFWALVAILVVGVLLLNTVVTLLGNRFPLSVDLTAGGAFKLEKETRDFVRDLDKDVQIYVLASADDFLSESYLIQAQRIIELFPQYSQRISLSYVDYTSDPTFASRFPGLSLAEGNILVVGDGGSRVKQIKLSELFNFSYVDESGNMAISSSRAEEAITSAIINVTTDDQVKMALLVGNGAADMPALSQVLTDNNYYIEEINLATSDIDASFDFALLLAPQTDYTENEMAKIDAFLYNGGDYGKTLFYTADVTQPKLPNIEALLREWGVVVGDGVVFETNAARTYLNQPYYPMPDYADSEYKGMLIDASSKILLPMSRPLEVLFQYKDNNYTTLLLEFGASAGVRPSDAPDTFLASEAEQWGPMPALVLAEKRILVNGETQAKSNVIVSASTEMLETTTFYSTVLTNSEYLMNVFNTISGREDVVNVRPKSMGGYSFVITSQQAIGLGVALFVVVPVIIIGVGVGIWLKRRFS